jgi:hypothetical protein
MADNGTTSPRPPKRSRMDMEVDEAPAKAEEGVFKQHKLDLPMAANIFE